MTETSIDEVISTRQIDNYNKDRQSNIDKEKRQREEYHKDVKRRGKMG